ncbi:MAG: LiaI-LiaF-like domain-containing protein [Anaerolineae bacterium]
MRRSGMFWGGILILLGVLFLLDNLGIFAVSVWSLFWPIILIGVGLWVLWGVIFGRPIVATEQVSIPLDGATSARIRIRHGAGRLDVSGASLGAVLAEGTFQGGLEYRAQPGPSGLDVDMRSRRGAFRAPFLVFTPGDSLDWRLRLNADIPLQLDLETGASATRLDLSGLQVTELHLSTGASSTDIWMPGNAGSTRATVKSGAASVNINVPESVAARIRVQSGMASISVSRRFQRSDGGYESPDFATAANRLDLSVETGVGSVAIR